MSDEQPLELPRLTRLGALLEDWEEDASSAHSAYLSRIPRGPQTGLGKVDQALGGVLAIGLHFLHGSPGAGKTAFALQVAAHNGRAVEDPGELCPSLFVSCEMPVLELFRRHTSRVTGTYLGRLKSGELSPHDSLLEARQGAKAAPNLALLDATRAPAPWRYLERVAKQERGDAPRFLIVVDSLHSWAEGGAPEGQSEVEYLPKACSDLRRLAQSLQCPVLAIAERNRANMKNDGQSSGAGSRKIEYGAETIISLNADEGANANGETPIKMSFPKNRNGGVGRPIDLIFTGRTQSFREAF